MFNCHLYPLKIGKQVINFNLQQERFREAVPSPSVRIFKSKFDKHWSVLVKVNNSASEARNRLDDLLRSVPLIVGPLAYYMLIMA